MCTYFPNNKCQMMFWKLTKKPEGSAAAHTHTPLMLSPSTPEPSSRHNTSRPQSAPTNRIISNILLMSQNYIKSLKKDEYTWQGLSLRGSIGTQPMHLALVWQTPKQEYAQRFYFHFFRRAIYQTHGILLHAKPKVYFTVIFFQLSDPWHEKDILWLAPCHNEVRNGQYLALKCLIGYTNRTTCLKKYEVHTRAMYVSLISFL